MKVLPMYSTIPEAVQWLSEQTNSKWSENEFLDFALGHGITLHAGPPISQSAGLLKLDVEGLRNRSNPNGLKQICSTGWGMAQLFPIHIAQILYVGETETINAQEPPDIKEWEFSLFPEPIKVTRDQLRISSKRLHALLHRFKQSPCHNPNSIAPSGAPKNTESPATAKPLPAQRFQEQEILRVIRELGYDPAKLPKAKPGTKGIKSKVRSRLTLTVKVFNMAWERLRAGAEIQDKQ